MEGHLREMFEDLSISFNREYKRSLITPKRKKHTRDDEHSIGS
jgi:hypothetical protein